MEATGGQVAIDAPSNGAFVRTNRVEYDLKDNRVTVQSADGQPDSVVVWRQNEYRGRDLTVTQPEQGRLAKASGKGSGWLRVVPPKRPDQVLEASWTRELTMRPTEDGQHLISLVGGAETKFTEFGVLSADQIDIWLIELAKPALPRSPTSIESLPATPVRMLAERNVRFKSTQLTGTTQRLDVTFGNKESDEAIPLSTHSAPPGLHSSTQPASAPAAVIRAARPVCTNRRSAVGREQAQGTFWIVWR